MVKSVGIKLTIDGYLYTDVLDTNSKIKLGNFRTSVSRGTVSNSFGDITIDMSQFETNHNYKSTYEVVIQLVTNGTNTNTIFKGFCYISSSSGGKVILRPNVQNPEGEICPTTTCSTCDQVEATDTIYIPLVFGDVKKVELQKLSNYNNEYVAPYNGVVTACYSNDQIVEVTQNGSNYSTTIWNETIGDITFDLSYTGTIPSPPVAGTTYPTPTINFNDPDVDVDFVINNQWTGLLVGRLKTYGGWKVHDEKMGTGGYQNLSTQIEPMFVGLVSAKDYDFKFVVTRSDIRSINNFPSIVAVTFTTIANDRIEVIENDINQEVIDRGNAITGVEGLINDLWQNTVINGKTVTEATQTTVSVNNMILGGTHIYHDTNMSYWIYGDETDYTNHSHVGIGTDRTVIQHTDNYTQKIELFDNGFSFEVDGNKIISFENGQLSIGTTIADTNIKIGSSTLDTLLTPPPPANNPPVIGSFGISPTSGDTSTTFSLTTSASDSDGDSLTYSYESDVDGTITNPSSFTLTENTHTITVTVSDGNGGVVVDTLSVTVSAVASNNPPVISNMVASSNVPEGGAYSIEFDITDSDSSNFYVKIWENYSQVILHEDYGVTTTTPYSYVGTAETSWNVGDNLKFVALVKDGSGNTSNYLSSNATVVVSPTNPVTATVTTFRVNSGSAWVNGNTVFRISFDVGMSVNDSQPLLLEVKSGNYYTSTTIGSDYNSLHTDILALGITSTGTYTFDLTVKEYSTGNVLDVEVVSYTV
jgi:hypothetical protein